MSSTQRSTSFHCPGTLPPSAGYSHVVQSTGGTLVHISGQVARTADGNLIGADDFAAQVEQCFENIKLAIESAGGTMGDIVKLNYYCDQRVPPTAQRAVVEKRDRYVSQGSRSPYDVRGDMVLRKLFGPFRAVSRRFLSSLLEN